MATSFPTGLDALTNPTGSSALTSPDHAGQHADINDAVEALEAKVGVDGSAVTSSLDYKVTNGIFSALAVDTNVLVVDAPNNRVGVGTSSPAYSLDVRGEMRSLFYGEKWTITGTAASSTLNIVTTTSCNIYTNVNSTSNWQITVGASSYNISDRMAIGDTFTITHASKQGATGYRMSGFIFIDGIHLINNHEIKWQGGVAPTVGNTNTTDVYVFTIMKTGSSSFAVFGSLTKFGT